MNLSQKEKQKLISTLRWVLTATIMEETEKQLVMSILRKVESKPIAARDVFES